MTEETLFALALEKPDGAERQAFLDQACGGDAALRQRVEQLLAADRNTRGILERGPDPTATGAGPPESLAVGRVFAGRFKLRQKLGEGGMGEVWVADQTDPVQRRVALKVVRPGLDSARWLARFDQERQALALMDHPNIARVLDAGVADGRPYFVMELIKGVPVTEYCDAAKLTPRERLELFIPVCHAVQHAHQKGVIHRDLKPSNILVGLYDGRPVPKVIDFGVAKATGPRLTEQSIYTEVGSLIGTLEYMSPEQAELNNLDVDTRSDVYTLGVVLYELLTGTVPFSRRELKGAAFAEVLRMIKEVEPPKPSTRLSGSGALPGVAAVRQTEPKKLLALVRGELDWIVMKALEKDRNRRYETANGFAMDVQRYLADEPVLASPPSTAYRVRKFVRRNRRAVLAGAAILLLLVAGVVGTTVGLVRAQRAQDSAEKRLAQVERGIDLLGLMFADLDPYAEEKEGRPLRAILGDRLDRAAAELEGEALGDPLIVARLQDRLGQTYLGLGQAAKAEALFNVVVATREAHLGGDHPLTLAGRHNQALAVNAAGNPGEAIRLLRQVHDARVKVLGAEHADTLTTLHHLGETSDFGGNENEAVRLLEQARDGRVKQLGEHHADTIQTLSSLARAYQSEGRKAEAITLVEQVRNAQVKKYGEDHPLAIEAMYSLAHAYSVGYKMKPAFDLFEQARKLAVPKLGPEHPLTLRILHSLGVMYRAYQKTDQAIALLEQVRERRVMLLGGHHPVTLNTMHQLGLAYQDAGELDKALALSQQAAAGVERLQFARSTGDSIIPQLCFLHERLNQYDQAEVWRRKWLAVMKVRDGPESLIYVGLRGLAGLGWNLLKQQKCAEAEPILRDSLVILQAKEPGDWTTFYTQALLGGALLGQKKYAEAEPLLVHGYQGMKKTEKRQGHTFPGSRTPAKVTETLEWLVRLYEETNKPDEAAKWRKELEAHKAAGQAAPPKGK
jgi:tetratricopeptide (TPR) repeat protein/tRNA A-37 threonylcarbamoyl transferase component Bud32